MATFVLVHGAWHGRWCWSRVSERLDDMGHEVVAPTLTGLADRQASLGPEVDLGTHIADVTGLIEGLPSIDLFLCGHSYGGMVISGAAESIGERLSGIVFIDAFLPEDGDSCMKLGDASSEPDVALPPPPVELFALRDPDDVRWVGEMMTPHPANTLLDPVHLTGARERVPNKYYIWSTPGPGDAFAKASARVSNDPSWHVCKMDTGHHPMLDDPAGLAQILDNAVRTSSG